jgi:NADH-quinone oxidoreductase subunit J
MLLNIDTIFFYFFGSLAITSAFFVISSKNPIYSILWLILTFCNATAMLIILQLEFLAIMLIIIYVGAIAILFLFVVMMIDIDVISHQGSKSEYFIMGSLVSGFLLFELFTVFKNSIVPLNPETQFTTKYENAQAFQAKLDTVHNIETIGRLLYTDYFAFYLIAGIILLVALMGAVSLTIVEKPEAKIQNVYLQVKRNSKNAIFLAK